MSKNLRILSACKCYRLGSKTDICDKTGKCQCRANFQGEKCNQCKEGYVGEFCDKCDSKHQNSPYEKGVCLRKFYTHIKAPAFHHLLSLACDCNLNGTSHCNDKGKCICKKNVTGDKCEQCASGHSGFPNCTCRSLCFR